MDSTNEPLAWMSKEDFEDYLSEDKKVTSATVFNFKLDIPLYTCPVKEHFEDEPQAEELHEILQSNLELTLTDEEIYACFHQYFVLGEPKPTHYELEYEDLIDFARAVLRKAQKK